MKNSITFALAILIVLAMTSCKKQMKCNAPDCGDGSSITFRIGDQQPNQASYDIDCDKEIFYVCFCANIPVDLSNQVWNAVVQQGLTPIASISSDNVGQTWKDKIPVDVSTYANNQANYSVKIFVGATNAGEKTSNSFTWQCQ